MADSIGHIIYPRTPYLAGTCLGRVPPTYPEKKTTIRKKKKKEIHINHLLFQVRLGTDTHLPWMLKISTRETHSMLLTLESWKALLRIDARRYNKLPIINDLDSNGVLDLFWSEHCDPTIDAMIEHSISYPKVA